MISLQLKTVCAVWQSRVMLFPLKGSLCQEPSLDWQDQGHQSLQGGGLLCALAFCHPCHSMINVHFVVTGGPSVDSDTAAVGSGRYR